MANYILGVETSSSNYKLFKEGSNLEEQTYTKVATLNNLNDSLIGAEETELIACPASIEVTEGTGEGGAKTYAISIGKDALPETSTAVDITATGEGVTLTLNDTGVDKFGATITNPAVGTVTAGETAATATIKGTLSAGWEQGTNKISYKVAATEQTIATITGLNVNAAAENLTVVAGESNAAGTITLAKEALPTSGSATLEATYSSATGGDFNLKVGDSQPTEVSNEFDKYVQVNVDNEGKLTAKWKVKDYWRGDGSKTITFNEGQTDNSHAIEITGLSENAAVGTNIDFDVTQQSATIKLYKEALKEDTSNVVEKKSGSVTLELATTTKTEGTATAVDLGGEKVDDNGIVVELGTPASETDTAVTATVKQKLTNGWQIPATGKANAGNVVYYKDRTDTLATISNVNKYANVDTDFTCAEANNVLTVTMASGALVKDKDKPATIAIAGSGILSSNIFAADTYPTTYKLARGTGVTEPGTISDSPITLEVTPVEDIEANANVTTTTAKVIQTLAEGWTLDFTNENTLTYKAETPITLATIDKVKRGAVVGEDISLDDKIITLENGALITDASNTITLTRGSTEATNEGYTDFNTQLNYTFDLGTEVVQDQTATTDYFVTDIKADASPATTYTATISQQMEEYFKVGATTASGTEVENTQITYTPRKANATPLATITGLKEGAKISAGTYDADETKRAEDYAADIVVNTVYKTVTLNSGAVPANPVETSTAAPTANATKIAITEPTSEYNLKLGTGLSAPATDLGKPKAGSAIDNSGNLAIVSTPSKGWASAEWNENTRENGEESKSFTYTQPADLTWATIKNLKAEAAATNVSVAPEVDTNGKLVVTLKKGALDEAATDSVTIEYAPTNNDEGAVHAFSFALNTTEGTDDDKVAVFGADSNAQTTPKLIVADADSQASDEPSGTQTAKIVVYDSAGWEVGTDETSGLPTVTFHKDDVPVVLAKVVNLADDATVKTVTDVYDNITFDDSTKEIKLFKAALQQGTTDYDTVNIDAGDYDVSLVASDKIAGYQESLFGGYKLATDEDVKAAGISYKSENLATDVTVTVDGGTVEIIGTLNQGWAFDANDPNVLKFTPANDTAILATITNLSTSADDTNISVAAEEDTNGDPTGKVIIALKKDAFVFNDDDETSDDGAAADKPVVLTNSITDVSNFKLTLTDGTDTVDTFGFEENYSWAVSDTTAKYNKANEEGWTLTTSGDNANKEVVYKARVDPETGTTGVTNLISISNLASGLTVDTMESGSKTITAVGTWDESDNTFTPGLWVYTDYVPANEDDNEPETEGALTISRNVLGTGTSTFTLTGSSYAISLNADTTADNAKDLYVLKKSDFGGNADTPVVDKYYWTYNPTSGSTGYYKTTPAYWTFDETAKTITYTAPKSATQVLQLSGVAKELTLGDYDDYYKIGSTSAFTSNVIIYGNFDETTDHDSLINVTPYVEDDTETEGDQSVLGVVTFSQEALGETKVTLGNTNKKLYTLELKDVTAPEFDDEAWSVDGTTATYTADITAGHTLTDKADDGSFKSISYTAEGSAKDIAVITGLKSGITAELDAIDGITVTDNVITLGEAVLGTSPSIKLANKTNTEFSLALGDGIPDYAIDDENNKQEIDKGTDVWRLNNTTAAFKHIRPAYYQTINSTTINYTPEATKATYVTVYNLKSGLVEEDGKILAQAGDTNELLSTEAADSENPGVITVKQGALGTTTVTLTNGKDTENKAVKYTFDLDNVKAVGITGTPAWAVANGTATYTGKLTEGWGLTSNDTNIKYYAAKDSQVLATITNLKSTATDSLITKEASFDDATAMTGTFELAEQAFDAKDVKLTNSTLDDGTKLDYSIDINADLATKTTAAETGDKRWYFDKEESTTLNYGVVHDAHYKQAAADATTIEYIEEEQEDPISQITNLAEGLKLNESDPTYFLETADGKYYKTEGTAPVTGITVNYSAKTVTPTAAVLGKDATKPTEVKNTLNSFNLKFVQDSTVTLPQAQKLLNLDSAGSKLTLYDAKGEGYEFTPSKITYVEAEKATDSNTIATVSGFKSGLVKEDGSETKIGTYSGDPAAFTAAITLDLNKKMFKVNAGAVDTENKNTVITVADGAKGSGYKLELDSTDFNATNTPQAANGWIYSSGTATFNTGKTAGWAIPADGTNKGKVVYLAANFATDAEATNTIATVTGLKKSGLAVSADGQQITDTKTGNAAVTADTATANTVDVKLTSYALNKADVLLQKGDAMGFTTYQLSLDSDAKITQGGVEVDNPGYVAGKTVQRIWTKVKDNNKATYTVDTKEGYNVAATDKVPTGSDAAVLYTKTSKIATTITGIDTALTPDNEGDGNKITGITVTKTDDDGHVGTITVTKAALFKPADTVKEFKIKLANGNGNNYTLELSDASTSTGKRWHVKNGTATYVDAYEAKSYVESNTNEITYTRDAKNVTLATVTGLNKTLAATPDAGVTNDDAGTTYGIKALTDFKVGETTKTTTDLSTGVESTSTEAIKADVIALGDRTKLATGTVTLKNGTGSDYRLAMTNSNFSAAEDFTATQYKEDTPLLTYNKGTLTLAIGTGESWDYTVKNAGKQNETTDYNSLTYKKAAPFTVATVKGLNTTLTLKNNTLYDSTGNTQVVSLGTGDGTSADPYEIKLTSGALFTTPKDNTKITLTLPKANARTYPTVYQYTLEADNIDVASTDLDSTEIVNTDKKVKVGDRVWSIEKGAASYQYDTSAGWTFAEDGKTVTYTKKKTNVLAKINGVSKDWTTTVTDANGNVTSTTAKPTDIVTGTVKYNDIIEIAGDTVLSGSSDTLQTDNGDPLITFTLKNSDYLALGKVSITTVDKSGTKYYVLADESLAVKDYDPKWTVKGTAGTATLTSGKTKGYSNAYEEGTSKYGTAVNYTAEKASVTYATVKGLKKDDKNETDPNKLLETLIGKGALTFNTATQKIGITDAVLDTTTVSITNGKIPETNNKESYSYTFDGSIESDATSTKISQSTVTAPKFQIKANSGVVNVVRESAAEKFTLSLDKTKLEYNKTAKDTILATVKGLNKELNVNANNKVVVGTGTDEVVTLAGGIITLSKDALADANVSFSQNKALEEGTYSVVLANGVKTDSNAQSNINGWSVSKGTATYKNYNEGYYKVDNKGGYTYVKEKNNYIYATISGLNTTLTNVSGFANDGTYGGEITITDAMLVNDNKNNVYTGKNVTLSNKTANGITAKFTLKLDSTLTRKSTLEADTKFVKGKLTGTQTAGYLQASDTSITYLAKAKENQLIATLSGINTNKDVSVTGASKSTGGTIALTKDNLTNDKGVTLNKTVTLTTTDLAAANNLNYTISGVTGVTTDRALSGTWGAVKSNTATFTGLATAAYTLEDSKKSVTYTKAIGTPADGTKPAKLATVMTVKNITNIESGGTKDGVTVTGNVSNKAATMSNGLIPVTFKNTNNIVGSNDADTIILSGNTGASVKGGKGDDKITLGSGNDTILYANGDGFDTIADFTVGKDKDIIKITSGKVTSVEQVDSDAVIKVGTGAITLTGKGSAIASINIVDNKNAQLNPHYTGSADVLLADDNYSMDAAALSDIVEPFHAGYTPYDFESGLDLVKQNAFAPALTYTGNDKK